MSNLQAALDFLSKFPDAKLFPAEYNTQDSAHRGFIKWGAGSSSDPDQIKSWAKKFKGCYFCCNYRVSGIRVIDIDMKKGKNGAAEIMALELANEDLPRTLTVATPSGNGRHLYFVGECAFSLGKIGALEPGKRSGIDIPGMTPVPGSFVPGKGEYKIIEDATAAQIPSWWVELTGTFQPRPINQETGNLVELDMEHNVEKAIWYLKEQAPEAIEGSNGDDTAYRVSCKVRDFGLSLERASEIMHEHYTTKCTPPDLGWLEEKVNNAYNYAQNSMIGVLATKDSPEEAFAEIEVTQDDDWPRPAGSYEGAPPETEWIVDGWIPKGDAVLFTGEGGIGKSLLMMQLEAHVAAGRTFLGNIVEQCKVLHVLCEDDDREIHRRYDRIRRSPEFAFTPDDVSIMGLGLQFWSRVGKDAVLCAAEGSIVHTKPFFDKLRKALDRMGQGHKLLVLDTLADVFAGNENDRSQVNQFVKNYIMNLARNHDCTPVIIGHPPKSGAEYSGSTAWNGAVRSRMYMAPHEKKTMADEYRVLHLPKSNRGKSGLKITVKYDKGIFSFVNEVEVVDVAEEHNLNMVMDAVITYAHKGTPIGLANTSKVKTKDLTITGHNGENLEPGEIRRLIRILIDKGDVYEKTGTKYENGVWPMGGN